MNRVEGDRGRLRAIRHPRRLDQEARRARTVATAEPISTARTAADSTGTTGMPPVSGSSLEGVALLVALEVGLAEALLVALGVAEAEALPATLAEADALETGLAVALSSIPRSSKPRSSMPRSSAARTSTPWSSKPRSSAPRACIPLSSPPLSSDWADATGAKANTANATNKTSTMDLRIVPPRCRLRIQGKDAPRRDA
jgi:hypothetical protein